MHDFDPGKFFSVCSKIDIKKWALIVTKYTEFPQTDGKAGLVLSMPRLFSAVQGLPGM
jgi:hypothetical protein